ncbi:MAG: aldehyde dehydrogenase family protein, partial [Actinomycetota bacterium]|nr:aldehyde dehydrogenase family protein [Actinomycetota bacterium]
MTAVTLPTPTALTDLTNAALQACGAPGLVATGAQLARSPITGTTLGGVGAATSIDQIATRANTAFRAWRTTPA